jgi:hypothetical protein
MLVMTPSFHETVATAYSGSQTIRVALDSGHELELWVQGLGDDWLSGETSGGENTTVVIPLRAITVLRFGDARRDPALRSRDSESPAASSHPKPLGVLVQSLATLRKSVSVYGVSSRWNGFLVAGHSDYLELTYGDSSDVAIPYRALSWIAVH